MVALVEIKARFDEQANIKWARALERAGCHVVYGVVGLKTHCKTALVVRQEGGQIRRYAHIGTGNYNPKTARLYEDLGLFTADESICADITDLFNVLTGYSRQTEYRSLLVAPQGVRIGPDRADRARDRARPRRAPRAHPDQDQPPGRRADHRRAVPRIAGRRRVELLVRTFCTIRAGVPGLSENITVRSILGRFLEHSRVFYFANGGEPEYWIGSADLMHRNLDRRVEVLCQVNDPSGARAHVRGCLDAAFDPETAAWDMQPDGTWKHSSAASGRLPGVADEAPVRPRRVEQPCPHNRSPRPAAWSGVRVAGRSSWPSYIGLVTTTGRCPRASCWPARARWPPRSARYARRLGAAGRRVAPDRYVVVRGRRGGEDGGLLVDALSRRRRSRPTRRSMRSPGSRPARRCDC